MNMGFGVAQLNTSGLRVHPLRTTGDHCMSQLRAHFVGGPSFIPLKARASPRGNC